MLVGQLVKETADVSRFTVDLTVAQALFATLLAGEAGQADWLNTETIVSLQTATVTLGGGQYSEWPIPTQPPYDPSPLRVTSQAIVNDSTAIQLFVSSGTPGNQYTVAVIVGDSAGRYLTCEFVVTVNGVAPVATNTGVPLVPSALPLGGGTMTGPLFLYRDPLGGTEAATKEYVDTKLSGGGATGPIAINTTVNPTPYAISITATLGGDYTSIIAPDAPFVQAAVDLRLVTSAAGGTTNAIWLPSGLGIAFDTAGAAGAAVGTLIGDGTVITSSVPVRVAGYATASLPALSSKAGALAWATDAKDLDGGTGVLVFRTAAGTWLTPWGAAPSTSVQPFTVAGALTAAAGLTVTTGGLTVTAGGATITAGGLTVSAGGAAVTGNSTIAGTLGVTGNTSVTGSLSATGALSGALFGYLSGLTMSNDGSLPNTVIDVAAGMCADSTNAVAITLGAFSKSIAGSWVAGTGANGMGTGLTASAGLWYHVFAIIVSGTPDIYFDTSVTAANKPASTTAFRRIGAIKLDGSVHIRQFLQVGDVFTWNAPILDVNAVTATSGAQNTVPLSVPSGVNVIAEIRLACGYASGGATTLTVYPMSATAAPAIPNVVSDSAGNNNDGYTRVVTDTSSQIHTKVIYGGSTTYSVETTGWIDPRGR